MPEAQHINTTASVVDPIENQIRGVHELLHSGTAPNIPAAFRKLQESFRPVEQRHSQPIRGLHISSGNMPNDGFEIVQCERLENYFEVH